RIDVLIIGLVVTVGGFVIYLLLQTAGIDAINAGIWSQSILVIGLLGWVFTYIFRVVTQNMTYNQQVKNYKDAVLQKQIEELSPEELAKLQSEIEKE
ncbi:MAG TPA: DUF3007 family protein, partial [Allocoleopsis sp.]